MTARWFRRFADQAIPIALFTAIWQALPTVELIDPSVLPSPVRVARALWDLAQTPSFYVDLGMTLWRGLAGLFLALQSEFHSAS
ncbi:hypothetical protein [Tardiphaga sp. vice154]|uniref:hypothetical protein n=1 Tax=Tardiphaga sp. vice154 TaxID=2592814 RepID=UPI00143D3C86|nr:hypothetical protein [Tardiphaga sp. vice154]